MEIPESKPPSLCLNMIVKNESKIITRLLDSIFSIIDCYCICDTGSNDDTVELIETYFLNKQIPGKIVVEPFQNFAYNRNFALKSCLGMSDFVILLDADMTINTTHFDKNILASYDSGTILQGNEHFYYLNKRIVRNNGLYNYVGVTHEYIDTPPDNKNYDFKKNELFINDIGDGGSKSNKFERDIKLLLNGIRDEPNNVRYHFYLANTYKDSGKFQEAIEYYEKRIKFGGWKDEVWQSMYRIGLCYKDMNNIKSAIYYWLNAHDLFPERIENLYQIIKHYRESGKQKLAYQFYKMALQELDKNDNRDFYLFLENDVYTYKLYYEYTVIAYYIGIKNIDNEFLKIVNTKNIDESLYINMLTNFIFYAKKLEPTSLIDVTNELNIKLNGELTKFRSSSSCLIPSKDGYLVNVRYVNYYITQSGSYENCDKYIATLNKTLVFTRDFQVKDAKIFELNFEDRRYIGVEDVRIFEDIKTSQILFTGTGFHQDYKIGIVCGNYDTESDKLIPTEVKCSFNDSHCEKNWVFVDYNNSTHMIYNWHPLQICKLNEEKTVLNLVTTKEMPEFFSHIRGSTCGFTYYKKIVFEGHRDSNSDSNSNSDGHGDSDKIQLQIYEKEIWFIGHLVSYQNPRHYYHIIMIFDENMNLLRYSAPFKFEGTPIEYCLSMIVEEDRVIINYSCWDRTTKIAIYDKKYIDSIVNVNVTN
jgi:tetratricopeptide (TPR) repeat protein